MERALANSLLVSVNKGTDVLKGLWSAVKDTRSDIDHMEDVVRRMKSRLRASKEKACNLGTFLTIVKEAAAGKPVATLASNFEEFTEWVQVHTDREYRDIFTAPDKLTQDVTFRFQFGGYKCGGVLDKRVTVAKYKGLLSAIRRKGLVPSVAFEQLKELSVEPRNGPDVDFDDMGNEVWGDSKCSVLLYVLRMKEEFVKAFEGQRFQDDDVGAESDKNDDSDDDYDSEDEEDDDEEKQQQEDNEEHEDQDDDAHDDNEPSLKRKREC